MTKQNFSYYRTNGAPLKLWDGAGFFEDGAMEQLRNVASLPFIFKHVAGMPDVHFGMGATIGSVIATKGAVIPAAVGVDIGCGMLAHQTTLKADDLTETRLHDLRIAIEKAVPHGRTDNGGHNDRGAWGQKLPSIACNAWNKMAQQYTDMIAKHPKSQAYNDLVHMGTLGTLLSCVSTSTTTSGSSFTLALVDQATVSVPTSSKRLRKR